MCGATNYGHLLGCAATIANINEYQERNLINNSRELGEVLKEKLLDLKCKYEHIGDIRCKGLFACIEFVKNKETKEPINIEDIIPLLIKNGFWTLSRKNIIMIAPPLIIKEQELLDAIRILERTIEEYENIKFK